MVGNWRMARRFRTGMARMSGSWYDGVKSVMSIRLVFNVSNATVRFHQWIFAFDDVAVSLFDLFFDITGMVVFYAVVETIFRICLKFVRIRRYLMIRFNRFNEFAVGSLQSQIENKHRRGRSSVADTNVYRIWDIVRMVETELNLTYTIVQQIWPNELGIRKICSKRVQRTITRDQEGIAQGEVN